MKKIFLKLNDKKSRYWMFEGAQTQNYILYGLFFVLDEVGFSNYHLDIINDKKVLLWDADYMKDSANIDFTSKQEMEVYYKAYDEYTDKRWDDMPKLEMSLENYQEIKNKWKDVSAKMPEYIIFSQDDTGYVDLVGKAELLQKDLADMKLEHQKFLKRQDAWQKYEKANPNRSEVWRSPEDSEFEADWQKYLED